TTLSSYHLHKWKRSSEPIGRSITRKRLSCWPHTWWIITKGAKAGFKRYSKPPLPIYCCNRFSIKRYRYKRSKSCYQCPAPQGRRLLHSPSRQNSQSEHGGNCH